MPRIHSDLILPSILALLLGGCGDPSGPGKSASESEVKGLRIIRNRCAMYAFGFGDSLGFWGCRPYLSPGKAFSLSDPRSLSTRDFIDLMGDWGAYDSLDVFHAYQETLRVEDPGGDWSRAFTVESGPIIALEFTLASDLSNRDSLTVSHLGRRGVLRRERDYFPAAAETFFRIPMTRVGNGDDDDRNGQVDDFAELEYSRLEIGTNNQQSVDIRDGETGERIFKLAVGMDSRHSIINPLDQYVGPEGDTSRIGAPHPMVMRHHPDSGWTMRGEYPLRAGKEGILIAATLYRGPTQDFTDRISVKLFTVDRRDSKVVLNKPLIYRFDPARHPFGPLKPPADPFNGDMRPGEIHLAARKSAIQDLEEYQLLLWLPTRDLARVFEGGVPVSDLKGRRFARVEFEQPWSFPGPYPPGERRNISAYNQELFLE